ncbi:serine/threonine-protein kinase 11-interacting protein isoform X2 [Leptopilina boulardi]|uniref:serine/threonine-protein kinase 11-interacting protein isoform X2 n=1 Tax=Leptopilina boulardi TaxID=63433 RepID=UPI0021F5A424|nr:serine/threonine-protein kinase 11-interacting protein isoform X2 [Leptopilina boulardi]
MSELSSNPMTMSGIQEIIELAKLLRQNGDKILNGTSKLSLSTTLLHNLNQVFHQIVNEADDLESSFQVCNSSKNDVFRDIKFLHDFVQKTLGLKITCNLADAKVDIDISKFRHLKYLELQKVCIELTKGIQSIRGQLECVICAGGRGVSSIGHLLAACGGDAGVGFVWNSLNRLFLPYNALTGLDKSLELTPWLQMLDLSHNLISKAPEIDCLPSLKYVNLGFNKLETVPPFHKATFHTLQKLILKSNYIDNIKGLQGLENLVELDLSYNCLTDHYNLWPLETMSGLLWLSLEGNPISYHPNHRLLSLKHLHPCLSGSKFVLDRLPLTRSEKILVSENRNYSIRSIGAVPREYFSSVSDFASENSSTSLEASFCDDNSEKRQFLDGMDSLSTSVTSITKSKRKKTVKEAIIAEEDHDKEKSPGKPASLSSSFMESSMEHLETKRQILALRKQFGEDNWLSHRAGTVIQNIMGIDSEIDVVPSSSPIPSMKILESLENLNQNETNDIDDKIEGIDETVNNENESQSDSLAIIETSSKEHNEEPVYNPEEELGDLYLVQKKKNEQNLEEVFLIVTSEEVKERDYITGKLKFRWSTETVLSCVMGRGTPTTVNIIFDTTRKDRQTRTYLVEIDDAKKIVKTLNERIITRSIELKVYKCMKCSTHFSHDTEITTVSMLPGLGPPKCPACQSTLVIQTDDFNTPTAENSKNQMKSGGETQKDILDSNLKHSESQSSIGSAASLEDSRESTPSGGTNAKKSESDIEVLSNPSQSSIEVLDEGSKSNLTPKRKKSEGQRNAGVSSEITPIMAGLTESSSSGSMTDSVCTAYENKNVKLCDISEMSHSSDNVDNDAIKNVEIEKETVFMPVTNLTSMLGELLQTMKIGSTKTTPTKSEESSEFMGSDVHYSYTDFNSVDHRIKLHIILNVFEQEKEELVLLLRAEIFTPTSSKTFPGCLVLSTSKIYILKIFGPEGEDPQRWLKKEASWTMDRLRSFAPLPFKQGLLVQLEMPNKTGEDIQNFTLLCILQDFQRTSSFLFYLTELSLPASCEVEFIVPDHCNFSIKNMLLTSKNHRQSDLVRLLAIFSSAIVKSEKCTTKLNTSGLVTTSSTLIILEDNLQWLLPDHNKTPAIAIEQALSNLIAVDIEVDSKTENGNATLNLSFSDEMAGLEETWILEFVSVGAAESVVNSIQLPWEELFSVPLQIETRILDTTKNIER